MTPLTAALSGLAATPVLVLVSRRIRQAWRVHRWRQELRWLDLWVDAWGMEVGR